MTISRKEFLRTSALALTLPYLSQVDVFAKPIKKIGLQLYTLRNEFGKDVEGTLKKVADIGYQEVETFGYAGGKFFGKTPAEFKTLLTSLNLTSPSGHYMPNNLKKDWNVAVEHAAGIGQKYMMCAFLFPQDRKTIDDYKKLCDTLNTAGEVCQKAGIQFGYHNHDFEFETLDGQVPYQVMLSGTDPKLVKMELDLYWAIRAGQDPVELFRKNPGRFPLVHLKDIAKTEKREFAEVGTGSVDFQRILDAHKTAGIQHYFVEQDAVVKGSPLEAIAISYQNVQKLRV
ncbi:sugar phosphate isomerase/epimerase family protein [Spirosoma sordidisoli]|uniref:Sugar phosphate isomerase/epimerase n=1 Tax=Spirosoma sordidisoli TaxID=2502893 RepID=A0A4Q2UDZ5_9BACT|nr:sugar phosphate isomerase/epimerase [Spirosoma sordidisoli]RYC67184.1 sugar phosphate isomerase/epimerase [Spirosoma sordidisoli]